MAAFNGNSPILAPDLNHVVCGFPGVNVRTIGLGPDGRTLVFGPAHPAGSATSYYGHWLNAQTVVFDESDTQIATSTDPWTSASVVANQPSSSLSAGGLKWGIWQSAANRVLTNDGTTHAGARYPAFDASGRYIYATGWQNDSSTIFLNTGASIATAQHLVSTSPPHLSTQAACWTRIVGGRLQTWGWINGGAPVNLTVDATKDEFWALPVDTPSGPYVLSFHNPSIGGRMFLRPWGSTQLIDIGLAPDGLVEPDCVWDVARQGFLIVWASAGQLRGALVTAGNAGNPPPGGPPPRALQCDFLTQKPNLHGEYPNANATLRAQNRANYLARKYTDIFCPVYIGPDQADGTPYDYIASPGGFVPFQQEIVQSGLRVLTEIGFEGTNVGRNLYPASTLITAFNSLIPVIDPLTTSYLLGIEVEEYWTQGQLTAIGTALRGLTVKPIYVHFNSNRLSYGGNNLGWYASNPWCNGVCYQWGPKNATQPTTATITSVTMASVALLHGLTPPRKFIAGEYQTNAATQFRSVALGTAAMAAGADGFMNGGPGIGLPVNVPPPVPGPFPGPGPIPGNPFPELANIYIPIEHPVVDVETKDRVTRPWAQFFQTLREAFSGSIAGPNGTSLTSIRVDVGNQNQVISTMGPLPIESGGTGTRTGLTELSADNITFGELPPEIIADHSIEFVKLPQVGAGTILGRRSWSAGDLEPLTVGAGLEISGTVLQLLAAVQDVPGYGSGASASNGPGYRVPGWGTGA